MNEARGLKSSKILGFSRCNEGTIGDEAVNNRNPTGCKVIETISVLKFPQVQGSLQLARKVAIDQTAYSKTSNNGPSEKRTTSLQRTAHLPPIDFTIELIHFEPPRSGHLSTPNNGH